MKLPQHIGFIMDGNRRWAKTRGLQVFKGHKAGVENVEELIEYAMKQRISVISFWAFSTDNWQRSTVEVKALMNIFREMLSGPMVQRLIEKGAKFTIVGDMTRFPQDIQESSERVVAASKDNKAIIVNLCLNYGGREELITAINTLLKEGKTRITEEEFSKYLYTKGQPDVDLVIRTSGEQRHSGFLLWQSKNAEYYYTDVNWPDFDEKEFQKALRDYDSRHRRFGK